MIGVFVGVVGKDWVGVGSRVVVGVLITGVLVRVGMISVGGSKITIVGIMVGLGVSARRVGVGSSTGGGAAVSKPKPKQ
jgi:hypothetical protein